MGSRLREAIKAQRGRLGNEKPDFSEIFTVNVKPLHRFNRRVPPANPEQLCWLSEPRSEATVVGAALTLDCAIIKGSFAALTARAPAKPRASCHGSTRATVQFPRPEHILQFIAIWEADGYLVIALRKLRAFSHNASNRHNLLI